MPRQQSAEKLEQTKVALLMRSVAPTLSSHSGSLLVDMHTARQNTPDTSLYTQNAQPCTSHSTNLLLQAYICKDDRLPTVHAETTSSEQAAADHDSRSNQVTDTSAAN